MFYLRIIDQNEETNKLIGSEYSLVLKSQNPDYFKMQERDNFGEHSGSPDCIGFICTSNSVTPLYNFNRYYIMGEDGKTYDNISNRL